MFQESEIVNLLAGFGSVPVIVVLARRVRLPRARLLFSAFSCVLAGYVFTVAEGVFWFDLLNHLEHLSYAAAGLLFFAYLLLLCRAPAPPGDAA
ncbi:MAG: hypothetical protein IH608_13290 [Proteobacteria bacterium]|nr:hypothetical protein [Pseudomonadota bacterium]